MRSLANTGRRISYMKWKSDIKIAGSLALVISGIYVLYVSRWYSFTGLILIFLGFMLPLLSREKTLETGPVIKPKENYNRNAMDYNSVIKGSETRGNKITIMPGDTKTTIAIPSGLKKYLDDNKNGKETYGEELARLLNEH